MKIKLIVGALIVSIVAILLIAADLPISLFPNSPTPNDSDLFVLAQTQNPAHNKNIRYDQLRGAIRSGLATEQYVNNATNNLSFKFEVRTNSVALGFVTNINWTYGMTGSLSGATAVLGIDDSANTTTVSNGLITQIITASNSIVSANVFRTNQWTTNLASTPVNGEVRFQGFPGREFVTNNARTSTYEWDPTNQSVRIGSIGNVGVDSHTYIATSNYWDNPNLGLLSWAFGSNNLVNARLSAVASGVKNLIYTNAGSSFIGGGTNNAIHTNAYSSVLSGGEDNLIRVDSKQSVIAGGQGNIVDGGSIATVISGGLGNSTRGGGNSYSVISGGNNNVVGKTGDAAGVTDRAFVGGGEQNTTRGNYVSVVGGQLNIMQGASDWSFMGGGQSNNVGTAPSFGVNYATISGGAQNIIANDADYSVIDGGRLNSIGSSGSNSWIGGGAFNLMTPFPKFAIIPGGERNTITANYGYAIGTSNEVTAIRAGAIGVGASNAVADTLVAANLREYRSISTVAGAGTGSTNYTLQAISPRNYLGSSNVNIVAVMQTVPGRIHNWSVIITNLSADTWGFSFSAATNRVKWQSYMYGTNAPVVLTNNTLLRLAGESEGTNTLVTYEYFRPAL